jgi:hypothetical protein
MVVLVDLVVEEDHQLLDLVAMVDQLPQEM